MFRMQRHLVPIVASIWEDIYDRHSDHDRDVLAVLQSLEAIYELLDVTDYVLSPEQKRKFLDMTWMFTLRYRALRAAAGDSRRWNEVPKFHYLWHLAFDAQLTNPRFALCYPDEDFMRIMKAPPIA